jgi:hypothetical protein
MAAPELGADTAGLLGVLTMSGVDASAAPDLLRSQIAAHPSLRDRKDVFRTIVRAGIKSAPSGVGVACPDMPYFAAFETLEPDERVGLFLLSMLEFDLRDTAYILDTEHSVLGARLERALDRLEQARFPHKTRDF